MSRDLTRALQLDATGTSEPVRPGVARYDGWAGTIELCCPFCATGLAMDGEPLVDKTWHDRPRGTGEVEVPSALRAKLDACAPGGWDVRCASCGAGFRILYDVIEWQKMSNRFVARVRELVFEGR